MFLDKIFNKNKNKQRLILTSFSIMRIGTGQIGGYILDKLYKELGFSNIGYSINRNRCYLYTLPENTQYLEYFNDRSSAMIEDEVINSIPKAHSFNDWDNGFSEVTEYKYY